MSTAFPNASENKETNKQMHQIACCAIVHLLGPSHKRALIIPLPWQREWFLGYDGSCHMFSFKSTDSIVSRGENRGGDPSVPVNLELSRDPLLLACY